MREIVLDTETTGMEPSRGDRLVEIGCVELLNGVPTGRTWHTYLNPERDIPAEATAVHGITTAFVKDKPVFSQVYGDMLDFIGDDGRLVIHNAEFDMKFINAELASVGNRPFPSKRVTDTLLMARMKFPGSPASLDALCRRFDIDNSHRELHGALLDAQLLAEVYLELIGGRQHGLGLSADAAKSQDDETVSVTAGRSKKKKQRAPRPHAATAAEESAHAALLKELTDPVWVREQA